MKNRSESRIVRIFRRIINVRLWIDWDRLKSFNLYMISVIKNLFIPQKPNVTESFDAAKKRLNLSDTVILARQKGLLRLTILMLCCAFLLFIYAIYLLFLGGYRGSLVSLVVMCIALVLAFRYHFWYFQIKEKKLGCTFREWFTKSLTGGKNE